MTDEQKKPVILIADDEVEKETDVKDGVVNLAESLGYNGDKIRDSIVIFTNPEKAQDFISKGASENGQLITTAFIDNYFSYPKELGGLHTREKKGVPLTISTYEHNPECEIIWNSTEQINNTEADLIEKVGITDNNQPLLYRDNIDLKYHLLNDLLDDARIVACHQCATRPIGG